MGVCDLNWVPCSFIYKCKWREMDIAIKEKKKMDAWISSLRAGDFRLVIMDVYLHHDTFKIALLHLPLKYVFTKMFISNHLLFFFWGWLRELYKSDRVQWGSSCAVVGWFSGVQGWLSGSFGIWSIWSFAQKLKGSAKYCPTVRFMVFFFFVIMLS